MNRLSSSLALCAAFTFACGATSSGTGGSGSISGTATLKGESDNSPIIVTLAGPSGQAAKVAADGSYTFRNLAPGPYAVIATAPSTAEGSVVATVTVAAGNSAAPALTLTPLGSLSGKATLGAATGNAGIVVVASTTAAVAVTDDAGDYTLTAIATGTYNVVASFAGQGSAQVTGVTVKYAQTVTVADMTLSPAVQPGSISGTVSLGASSAVGIAVSLLGPVPGAAITDSTGAYSFTGLPNGNYTVSAAAPSTLEGAVSVTVAVAGGAAATAPAITFSPLGDISGVATLSPAPQGSGGIVAVVIGTSSVGITDSSGNWKMNGVPTGDQQVLFSASGYLSQTVNVEVKYAQSVIAPSATLSKATAQGSLSGTVQLAGMPQADLTGAVTLTLSGPVSGAALTAANGNFSFTGLPDGSYAVSAVAHSTAEMEQTAFVVIANGAGPAANFTFTPLGSVSGVATVGGQGSGGIVVVAAGTSSSTATGPDGSFVLSGIPSGAATIIATQAALGMSGSVSVTVPYNSALALAAPLALTGSLYAGSISGSVGLANLTPAPDLTGVVALTLTGPVSQVAVTAADGSWSFSNLPDGTYAVSAAAPSTLEMTDSANSIAVAAGVSTPVQFSFTPLGSVTGTATAGGNGAGIVVVVAGSDVSANTNPDGSFTLAGVPSGLQTIVATQPGLGLSATAMVNVPYDGPVAAGALQLGTSTYSGALSGTVTMSGLSTQPDLTNIVAITLSGPVSSATLTTASGAWSFPNLPDGTYTATALAPDTAEGDQTVTGIVVAGGTASPVSFNFTPLGNITGTVDIDGAPSSGIFVAAAGTSASATTGSNGQYTLRGVPAGAGATIIATQASSGLSGGTSVSLVNYASSVTATLIALQSHTVPSTGQVSVTLGGIPPGDLQHVTLTLSGPISAAAVPTASPFNFGGLPSGTYAVTASMPSTVELSQSAAANVTQSTAGAASFTFTELGNVSGSVTVNGSGVAGVFVTAAGTNASATTNASGGYLLRGVPTGAGATIIATQQTSGLTGSTTVTVAYNTTATATAIALTSPAPATGQIAVALTGVSAGNFSQVTLTLTGPVSMAAVPTGASFNFTGLPNGTYSVIASMPSTLELSQATTAVAAQGTTKNVSFSFSQVGIVTGTVTVNGSGVAGVFVTAAGTNSSATTSAAGAYSLRGVPAGAGATIIATQLTTEYSGSTTVAAVNYAGTVNASAIALATPAAAPGSIAVTLGVPTADLSHVTLTLTGPVSAAAVPTASLFSFSGLPAGTYSVSASMPSTLELSQAAVVIVGTTAAATSFNFTETGSVNGSVTVNGTGVAGVFVTAAGTSASATTNASGAYTLRGIGVGAATIIATQITSGLSGSTTATVTYAGNTSATAIALTSPGAFTGQVNVTLTGVPVGDVSHVTLTLTGPVSMGVIPTGTSYSFSGLPSGSYSVTASMPSTAELMQTAQLNVTQSPAVNASFAFTEVGNVGGSVTLNGSGASGIFVTAVGSSVSATTNASGAYTLRGVPTSAAATIIATQLSSDLTGSTTTAVTYNATASATTIALATTPAAGIVAVTLTGVPTADLSHVTLTLVGPSSFATLATGTTTSFTGLVSGTYSVTATMPSTLELSQATAVTIGQGTTTVPFTFTEVGTATGNVTVNGSPVAGVFVTAGGTTSSATTTNAGAYALRGVPLGVAQIIATQQTSGASGTASATVTYNASVAATPSPIVLTTAQASGQLKVSIAGMTGGDLSNVFVSLVGPSSQAGQPATSGGNAGTITFSNLLNGSYVVTASAISTAEGSQSAAFTYSSGGLQNASFTFTEVGSVSGSVTVNGAAASGVFVTAAGTTSSATTGTAGTYVLHGVPTGAQNIIASQLSSDLTGNTSVTVPYNSSASASTIALASLPSAGGISVVLTGVPAGDVSHVTLSVQGPSFAASAASGTTTTFTGLLSGTYLVTATMPSTLEISQSSTVTVTSPSTASVPFAFTETGSASGSVTVNGAGAAGVFVTAAGTTSSATTSASGAFILRGVPTGAASIIATQLTSAASGTGSATVVYNTNASVAPNPIVLTAPTANGSLKVTIAGMTGTDFSNVWVTLVGPSSQAGQPATTGGNAGTITFTSLLNGNYVVTATALSTVEGSQSAVITEAGTAQNITFTFTETGSITGAVTLNGVGYGGASVVATVSGVSSSSISPAGTYALHGVPTGTVALTATGGGSYGTANATVTYRGTASTNIALSNSTASGSISGTVLVKGQSGLGIGGLTVTLAGPVGGGTTTSGSVAAIGSTGTTGNYSFTNLPDGKYAITVVGPATVEQSLTITGVTISGGNTMTGENFTLTPTGAFTGTVTAIGKPLPGILIYATATPTNPLNTTLTNSAGQFRLAGLPSFGGPYTVSAADTGYQAGAYAATSLNTSVYTTDTALGTLDLGAPGGATLAGIATLVGPPGAPESILVSLCQAGTVTVTGSCTLATVPSSDPNPVLVDSSGGYSFINLNGSSYVLHFGSTANGTNEDGNYIENIPVFAAPGTNGFVDDEGTLFPIAPLEVQHGLRIIESESSGGELVSSDKSKMLTLMNANCFSLSFNRGTFDAQSDARLIGRETCSGALYQVDTGGDPIPLSTYTTQYEFAPSNDAVVYTNSLNDGGTYQLEMLPNGGTSPVVLSNDLASDTYDNIIFSQDSSWMLFTDNYAAQMAALNTGGTASIYYGDDPPTTTVLAPDKTTAYLGFTGSTIAVGMAGCPGTGGSCGGCLDTGTCVYLGVLGSQYDSIVPSMATAADNSMIATYSNLINSQEDTYTSFVGGDYEYHFIGTLSTALESGVGFASGATSPTVIDTAALYTPPYSGWDGYVTSPSSWQLVEPTGSTPATKYVIWRDLGTATQGTGRQLKTESAEGVTGGPIHVLQTGDPNYNTYGLNALGAANPNYDVVDFKVVPVGTSFVVVWEAAVATADNCTTCTYVHEIFSANIDGTNVHRLQNIGVVPGSLLATGPGAPVPTAYWRSAQTNTLLQSAALVGGTATPVVSTPATFTGTFSNPFFSPSQKYLLFELTPVGTTAAVLYETQLSGARVAQQISSNGVGSYEFPELVRTNSASLDDTILISGTSDGLNIVDLTATASPNTGTVILDNAHAMQANFNSGTPPPISPADATGKPRLLYQTTLGAVNIGYLSTTGTIGSSTIFTATSPNVVQSATWSPNGNFVVIEQQDTSTTDLYELWTAFAPTSTTFTPVQNKLAIFSDPTCGFGRATCLQNFSNFNFTSDDQVAYSYSAADNELGNLYLAKISAAGVIQNNIITPPSSGAGAYEGTEVGINVDLPSVTLATNDAVFLSGYSLTNLTGTLQYAPFLTDATITIASPVGYSVGGDPYEISPSADRIVYGLGAVLGTVPPAELFEAKLDGNTPAPLALLHDASRAAWMTDNILYGQRTESPIPYRLQDGYYFDKVP